MIPESNIQLKNQRQQGTTGEETIRSTLDVQIIVQQCFVPDTLINTLLFVVIYSYISLKIDQCDDCSYKEADEGKKPAKSRSVNLLPFDLKVG